MTTRSSEGPTCPSCDTVYTPDEAYWFDEDLDMTIDCSCGAKFRVGYFRRDLWTGKLCAPTTKERKE